MTNEFAAVSELLMFLNSLVLIITVIILTNYSLFSPMANKSVFEATFNLKLYTFNPIDGLDQTDVYLTFYYFIRFIPRFV